MKRLSEVVKSRRSIRAFLPTEVPEQELREALELASFAPSGGNLQPWRLHVLTGSALKRFVASMETRLQERGPDPVEYKIYPDNLWEPYRSRRYELGESMYRALQIPREDKQGRLARFAANFRFFDAPVGLFCFVHRDMNAPQWSDLGMYLQTLMLILEERGIGSCAQEAWSTYHLSVSRFVQSDPAYMLFCGMSIGYADPSHPVNHFARERAPLEEFATFHET